MLCCWVFGLQIRIQLHIHSIHSVVFARWRQYARLGLGSHESTPNGVCITFWWFCCFTTAARRLAVVFARWHQGTMYHTSVHNGASGKYDCIYYMRPWCSDGIMQTEYWSNSTTPKASAIKYSDEYLLSRNIMHFWWNNMWILTDTDVQPRRLVRISVVQGTLSLYIARPELEIDRYM